MRISAMAFMLAIATQAAEVRPVDHGRALVNPSMGWVLHHYDNSLEKYGSKLALDDTVDDFPGVSVVYLRLAWSFVEPEEGRFDWSVVDAPAQRWIAKGKQVAFRFSASESGLEYATPRWVEQAGAKGYRFTPGKGVTADGRCWEPDFNDPVFLAKLDKFLAAAAARYDGSPHVAFIDVGSFGVWGEGHTFWSTKLNYDAATVAAHLDLHARRFKRTLLAANDDFASHGRGPQTIVQARELGMTLRDDSILVEPPPRSWHHADMATQFWPRLPYILESEHYGNSVKREAWGDGSLYLKAIEDHHASYASVHWWPREFLAANRGVVEAINRKLGYRLQIVSAAWPEVLSRGEIAEIRWTWRNGGVAPCYPGGFPALTLKTPQGGVAAVFVDTSLALRDLAPGKESTHAMRVRIPANVPPGNYEVFASAGDTIGTPVLNLPHEPLDQSKRVRLGVLAVR